MKTLREIFKKDKKEEEPVFSEEVSKKLDALGFKYKTINKGFNVR